MSSILHCHRIFAPVAVSVTSLLLFGASPVVAGEIHVYEGQSIQDAIDGAFDGDEIIVHPGTYPELIDFLGKAITVRSSDGPDVTTIDGTGLNGSVVKCYSPERFDSVLQGLTITGGDAWSRGGGMSIGEGSNPTITNCVFFHNTAEEYGGGIGISGAAIGASISNCLFLENTAGYGGGGLYYPGSNVVELTNCVFRNNSVLPDGNGGGAYLSGGETASTIVNCLFTGNSAEYHAGLYARNAIMTNCTIANNIASESSGGIRAYNTTMTNCTVANNIASEYGGAYADEDCTLTNCIFWGNTGNGYRDDLRASGAVVTYCDIGATSFCGHCEGEGNICADPVFVDPDNGDFHLGPGSSCADAGSDAAVPEGIDTDLDGEPRFVDADADAQPTVDMGAYEFQETCSGVQLAVPGDYGTIQQAIDAACFNDEIVVAPGTYPETVNLRGKPITLRSSGGPSVTTIDAGDLEGSVVLCINQEGPDTVLEGFTITGGSGTWNDWGDRRHGGGMYILHAGPTVNNCQFIANAVVDEYSRGGGLYVSGGDPVFSNCVFSDNAAPGGGAVAASQSDCDPCYWPSDPMFLDCTFSANSASDLGGAITVGWNCSLVLSNSTLSANIAAYDGGALWLSDESVISISECVFTGNTAGDRGGAALSWSDDLTITGCDFDENLAYTGGALSAQGEDSHLESCSFTGNIGTSAGGGISTEDGNILVSNCAFDANFALYGGGMYNSNEGPYDVVTLTGCTFTGNDAGYGGGLYCIEDGGTTVSNCDFIENTAFRGAGLRTYFGIVYIDGCSFQNNAALEAGGGASNWESYLAVGTSMFCGNQPDHIEGFYIDEGGNEFADECEGECPADFDDDGDVDTADLLHLLGAWGTPDGDVDNDGDTDTSDLLALLAAWGDCP